MINWTESKWPCGCPRHTCQCEIRGELVKCELVRCDTCQREYRICEEGSSDDPYLCDLCWADKNLNTAELKQDTDCNH